VEDSRKSSESDCSSSSVGDLSSDEEQFPTKKPSPSCHDSDQSVSSVCPTLSIASSESATVLRRSLRKIMEESKRDAASSSVSNSRESTPPRMSSSGRQISSRQVFTPGSSSRMLKKNSERLGTRSGRGVIASETTGVAKQLDFQRRSTRVRRIKRNVCDAATISVLSSSIVSSDDDSSSVKDSSRVCSSVSDLNMITDSTRLTSRVDTSDTDSRASSLCTYNTRSGTLGEVLAARANRRSGASGKQSCSGPPRLKAGKRSRVFRCVADELAKLQSSDSETDGYTSISQTPFFDPFPDHSSNGSSICSSVPAPELSADRSMDNCKNVVGSSVQAKETSAMMLDPDEADSKRSAELDMVEKAKINAKSPLNACKDSVSAEVQSSLLNKVTCIESEIAVSEDSVFNKGQLLDRSRFTQTAVEDRVVETKQEAKDASLAVNRDNLETPKDDMKVKECDDAHEPRVMDHTEDGEELASGCSRVVTCDGNEEHDINVKLKEEVDDTSSVKEEPPEILVSGIDLRCVFVKYQISENYCVIEKTRKVTSLVTQFVRYTKYHDQLFAVTSTPVANLSKMTASVPIVQFVMCSSAKTASSSMASVLGPNSATGPPNVAPVCTSFACITICL